MNKKVALVLSGGGAKGMAQIGVIEALIENDFEISSVSGTSIGSLVGGMLAMNKINEFSEWMKTIKKRDVIALTDFSFGNGGLIKGKKVFEKMKTFILDMLIEDLKIPFTAVAVDLLHEKEVYFSKGSVYDAIRASVSIPDVFVPVKYDDTLLVDGGVLNPVPINAIKRTSDDILVVVNLYNRDLMFKRDIELVRKEAEKDQKSLIKLRDKISKSINKEDKLSAGYFKLLNMSTDAMIHKLADFTIDKYRENIDILIDFPADLTGTFSFDKASSLIEYGKCQANKVLNEYLKSV